MLSGAEARALLVRLADACNAGKIEFLKRDDWEHAIFPHGIMKTDKEGKSTIYLPKTEMAQWKKRFLSTSAMEEIIIDAKIESHKKKKLAEIQQAEEDLREIEANIQSLRDKVGIERLRENLSKTRAQTRQSIADKRNALTIKLKSATDPVEQNALRQKFLRHQEKCLERIAIVEIVTARKIQDEIHRIPYEYNTYTANEVLSAQKINCRSASVVLENFLEEAGIDCLDANIPGHAFVIVVTETGELLWFDPVGGIDGKLSEKDISGRKPDGNPFTINDIVRFCKKKQQGHISFYVLTESGRHAGTWRARDERQCVNLFQPEVGQQIGLWWNLGCDLVGEGNLLEATNAFKEILKVEPTYYKAHLVLGDTYFKMGKNYFTETIHHYKMAIRSEPYNIEAYYELAKTFRLWGQHLPEAKDAYKKCLEFADPNYDKEIIDTVKTYMQRVY